MGSMTNIVEEFQPIFLAAQETAACHQKNSILLRKIYYRSDFNKFYDLIVRLVDHILQVDYKENHPYIDRGIEFIGVFCKCLKREPKHNIQEVAEEEEESFTEDPLITKLFEHLLVASRCILDTIRFRASQIISTVLNHLAGNNLSTELWDQLQTTLVDLLSDMKSAIRIQAFFALYRLQDPTDPEDEIVNEFIKLLYDSHAKVRQLCVEKIAARKDVIYHILKRTRDINQNVRLAAFKRLASFPREFKLTDRREILFTGIFDPSKDVNQFVLTKFLDSWLEFYDNNIVALMKSIRLDADDRDIKNTMDLYENILNKFYFKTKSLKELSEVLILNEEKVIPYEELTWETISYWKLFVIFLSQDEDRETYLASVVPEMVYFCRYIKGYTDYLKDCTKEEFLKKQFITKQLFLIIKTYDLADPARRQSLHTLVDFVLKKVDLMDDVVETIIGSLELTMPDPKTRCQYGIEIISDLLYPIDTPEELKKQQDREFALSKLKVQLHRLQEDQDKAIVSSEFMEAERLKGEIEDVTFQINDLKNKIYVMPAEVVEKTTDNVTIAKCLDIAWATLSTAGVTSLTPSLKSLKDGFITEMLIHQSEIVRIKALRCYAVCCIFDKPTAKHGIHIFAVPIAAYQAGEECDTETLILCISAVTDLIRMYGSGLIAEPSEDQMADSINEEHQKIFTGGTSLTVLIQGLVDLMHDELLEIQLFAIRGLCSLVLEERIHSAPLISRLILKWCEPVENDEPKAATLQQFIGQVLEMIPTRPNSAEQLEGAFLITINVLAKAPQNSPLADVDIYNIAMFMLALCKVSAKGQDSHSNLALSISTKINQHPTSNINSIYSKILLMFDVPDDAMIKRELYGLCEAARENITNKITLNNISKFMARLVENPQENIEREIPEEQYEES